MPDDRSPAGYRLYNPRAEQTLRFMKRAQRVGFSLDDIRTLLTDLDDEVLSDESVLEIAESRLLEIESRLTELLVQRHEMGLLLAEFRDRADGVTKSSESISDRLLNRICSIPSQRLEADTVLEWLFERTGCSLATHEGKVLLNSLRGQHFHIWQGDSAYYILVVGQEPSVESALRQLAQLENGCQLHAPPSIVEHEQGFLLTVRGENAFMYARLFLALGQE
ncbi:MAG: MerR family DNA-binding protein [Anaerolineales bacterium]|nr:MerR family DNA-binding protein [Anaerolineales bacterium]